jgi:hypothetical protein
LQSFRFLDNQLSYSPAEMLLLLRACRDNKCPDRLAFFQNTMMCRRREKQTWQTSTVADLFRLRHEVHFLTHHLILAKMHAQIMSGDASIRDVFAKFDVDSDGMLSQTELTWAINQCLCMRLTRDAVQDFVHVADLDENGLIDYFEFERVFQHVTTSSSDVCPDRKVSRRQSDAWSGKIEPMPASWKALHEEEMHNREQRLRQIAQVQEQELKRHQKLVSQRQLIREQLNDAFVSQELARIKRAREAERVARLQRLGRGWACAYCTVLNSMQEDVCNMCEKARPEQAHVADEGDIDVSDVKFAADPVTGLNFWACICSTQNRIGQGRCMNCEGLRLDRDKKAAIIEYQSCPGCSKIIEVGGLCGICSMMGPVSLPHARQKRSLSGAVHEPPHLKLSRYLDLFD